MISKVLPDLPALAMALAFFFVIVAVKVALAYRFARRHQPRESFVPAVALVFNVMMVPALLFPIFNPSLARSYDTVILLAGPLFWLLETAAYYFLAHVHVRPAAVLAVAVDVVQVAILFAAVFARDTILA